jgi:hypothetical protein
MKLMAIALSAFLVAGAASAQSGFGSSDVTSGEGAAGADSFDLTGLTPDDQTPQGKFTTAAEVGPILEMTQKNWAAVREYDGQDLVYFSHVFSWRCGLKAAKYSINDEPLKDLEMPDCHMKYQQPNALIDNEALMTFKRYELGSVKSVRVDVLLDNLTVQSVTLLRENILIP